MEKKMSNRWEVIVIGGGPGGALAAKKCAEKGLSTLLLEKKKMPRDKCCSGMVMGTWIQDIIKKEFGEYPDDMKNDTENLNGYAVHVPGEPVKELNIHTPAIWRKVLDTWMCKKAEEQGAELRDSMRVTSVKEIDGKCIVIVKKGEEQIELESEFIIGTDGANSVVRRSLFPDFKPKRLIGYRECYETRINMPENRFNIISPLNSFPIFFIHYKKNYMLLEGMAFEGMLNETIENARQYLIQNHEMRSDIKPLWRDGCVTHVMYKELSTKVFRPAKGNILIGGDAAGMNIPVTGEGLGASIKNGYDAAIAVIESKKSGKPAEGIYLNSIDELLEKYHDIFTYGLRIGNALKKKDYTEYSKSLAESWEYALTIL
jgi:flavin-dependent dehydrogenase